MLHLRGCAGLELTRGPFGCAVSVHHRLTAKDKLRLLPALNIPMDVLEKAVSIIKAACRED